MKTRKLCKTAQTRPMNPGIAWRRIQGTPKKRPKKRELLENELDVGVLKTGTADFG
jgi:hypothetical protein